MPDTDLKVRKRIYRAELGAYLLIVTMGALGFWQIGNLLDDVSTSQSCTEEFLGSTVEALNERTQYSTAQADANIELQKAQLKFIRVLVKPGPTPDDLGEQALNDYFDALTEYNRLTALQAGRAESNPYPTREDYRMCLNGGADEEESK